MHQGNRSNAVAGMRGGLGRILLTAFMLMAIVPLSVVSYLAIRRVQRDMDQTATDRLARLAQSTAAQLETWLDAQQYGLSIVARDAVLYSAVQQSQWETACSVLSKCSLVASRYVVEVDGRREAVCGIDSAVQAESRLVEADIEAVVRVSEPRVSLKAYVPLDAVGPMLELGELTRETRVFAVSPEGHRVLLASEPLLSDHLHSFSDLPVSENTQGSVRYENEHDEPVVGVHQHIPGYSLSILVEQSTSAFTDQEDDLAAMLIGSTLAVALMTAVLAAVITRQLTQPIVDLTISAVKIAGGDLDQSVDLDRRDEIGVLARAFNIMTTELRSVYNGLEQKVSDRTRQLTEANRELRYKAMQLKLSAEVGRVATSILDLDLLLCRVTELVLETYAHVYDVYYVAILLQDEFGERLERQAYSGSAASQPISISMVGDGSLVGQAAQSGRMCSRLLENGGVQVAIPLCIGPRVIGCLDVYCARADITAEGVGEVLQSLGDQISVAIENARVYEVEREAVQRLSRLDDLRLASLGTGSRELATELNTIIGFSRLILKEADGPLTELQRSDLSAIYKSGYKLLGLIDNVVTLSELDAGSFEGARQQVDMGGLLQEVVAMAHQRLVGTEIDYRQDGQWTVLGDESLLRQALLSLLVHAAEQVPRDRVVVCLDADSYEEGRLIVTMGGQTLETDAHSPADAEMSIDEVEEMGVGLALAQRIISLHRGGTSFQFDVEGGLNVAVVLDAL